MYIYKKKSIIFIFFLNKKNYQDSIRSLQESRILMLVTNGR